MKMKSKSEKNGRERRECEECIPLDLVAAGWSVAAATRWNDEWINPLKQFGVHVSPTYIKLFFVL